MTSTELVAEEVVYRKGKRLLSVRDSRNMQDSMPGLRIGDCVTCLSTGQNGTVVGFARNRVRIQCQDAVYQISPRELWVDKNSSPVELEANSDCPDKEDVGSPVSEIIAPDGRKVELAQQKYDQSDVAMHSQKMMGEMCKLREMLQQLETESETKAVELRALEAEKKMYAESTFSELNASHTDLAKTNDQVRALKAKMQQLQEAQQRHDPSVVATDSQNMKEEMQEMCATLREMLQRLEAESDANTIALLEKIRVCEGVAKEEPVTRSTKEMASATSMELEKAKVVAPDVIADEPCVRLGCLELYVRLTENGANGVKGCGFVVEEDQRQRVLVHWRNQPPGASLIDSSSFDLNEQTWRVSCAVSEKDADATLFETLGLEAVDWLWDGLSAVVLALAPSSDAESSSESLFGRGVYASEQFESHDQTWPRGLVGFCFEELCRRVDAEADKDRYCVGLSVWELLGSEAKDLLAARGEDSASDLRFETVQFRTAKEAFALLQAVASANDDKAARQRYFGAFRHPVCGDKAVHIRVVMKTECQGEWTTLGQTEQIRIVRDGRQIRMMDSRTELVGEETSSGVFKGIVIQDGSRGGEFWLMLEASRRFDVGRHLFVRAVVIDARRETMAALHFAQVAAGKSIDADAVNADRKVIWDLLDSASTGDSLEPKDHAKVAEVLTPLVAGNCKPFFLCSVPEAPHSKALASEAHDLLDLAERASLITAQCTRVHGVRREDFQLTDGRVVLARLEAEASALLSGETPAAKIKRKVSPEQMTVAIPPLEHNLPGVVRYSIAKNGLTPGSPRLATFPEEVVLSDTDAKATAGESHAIGSASNITTDRKEPSNVMPLTQPNRASLGARIAQAACLDECRELGEACAALRAQNEAKAAQRKKELLKVQVEVAALREELEGFEKDCEAPELLNEFKQEIQALRAEAARLREENAALAGAKGSDARRNAQISTLHSLKREVAKLRECTADVEQEEKHANLVAHCLQEVRVRLDTSKRRLVEADREFVALQPAYGELGRQIEHSERKRRWAQEELDKLRRASGGLRAEIAQLQEVRNCVDGLPAGANTTAASPSVADGATSNIGLERFAALQRRVAAAAPHLMPLCVRATSEMEELLRCCRHLEERQRRLEQVSPLADEVDTGGFSCSSSIASGATPRRARSSDTMSSHTGRRNSASHVALSLRPAATEVRRRSSSARSTPRSATPRAPTPRATTPRTTTPRATTPRGLRPSVGHELSSRQPSMSSYSQAYKSSWVLERDTSKHGTQSRSQERSVDGRLSYKASPRERDASVEGAACALRDLGLPVPLGSPARVQGVHLRPEGRAKSRERYSKSEFGSTPVLQRGMPKAW